MNSLIAALLPLAWLSGPAAAVKVDIKEWEVPWQASRPRDPYLDVQGRVWFVGQVGNYLAYLDPASGEFRRFEIPPGTGPHNLIVDAKGAVWFAGNRDAYIGKLDPASGEIQRYPMTDPAAKDPHTLVFDRNGDIWFTMQASNFVGKLQVASGEVQLIAVPTARALPYGIVVDSKNRPWFNEFGSNKIGTVDPVSMKLQEYSLPRQQARSRRIAITSDDAVWYVDYAGGYLGRLNTGTGEVREWPVPGGAQSRPYAMAVDDHERLWFVETGAQPNRLLGFDPKTEQFFSVTEIGSGGGAVRHMFFHKPSREIWFGTDTNTIGRARLP